ncbi:MAG TPA: hypothetical protein VF235_05280, partial [Actinomycetota bacterium]
MFDRFTRDEVSAKVWWPFALLLIVLLVLSFPLRNSLVESARDEGTADAVALVQQVVSPVLAGTDLSVPLGDEQASALRASIRTANTLAAAITIRLW